MYLARVLIFVNYIVLGAYTLTFVRTVWSGRVLESEVGFLLLSITTFMSLGIGWYQNTRRLHGESNPYKDIPFISIAHQVQMVRTHTLISVVGLLYLTIFLATIIVTVVTGTIHLLGFGGIIGYFLSRRLGTFYLQVQRKITEEKRSAMNAAAIQASSDNQTA